MEAYLNGCETTDPGEMLHFLLARSLTVAALFSCSPTINLQNRDRTQSAKVLATSRGTERSGPQPPRKIDVKHPFRYVYFPDPIHFTYAKYALNRLLLNFSLFATVNRDLMVVFPDGSSTLNVTFFSPGSTSRSRTFSPPTIN